MGRIVFHALPGERIDERFMLSRVLRWALGSTWRARFGIVGRA